jgi:hypothetical protein
MEAAAKFIIREVGTHKRVGSNTYESHAAATTDLPRLTEANGSDTPLEVVPLLLG